MRSTKIRLTNRLAISILLNVYFWCSSLIRKVRIRNDRVMVRTMAGTRPEKNFKMSWLIRV